MWGESYLPCIAYMPCKSFYVSLKGKNVDIWKYNYPYSQLEDFNTLIT